MKIFESKFIHSEFNLLEKRTLGKKGQENFPSSEASRADNEDIFMFDGSGN